MNNSNENNARKPGNIILVSAKVNDSTYDNAKSTDKTWFLGVENVITAIFGVLQK